MPRRGENIYHRKDGRWEGRYVTGYRQDGKAKYSSVYGRSYQEVKTKLTVLKASPAASADPGQLTFGALLEEWLTAVSLRIKPSTYANYRMKADKHILPAFGAIRYARIDAELIHHLYDRSSTAVCRQSTLLILSL